MVHREQHRGQCEPTLILFKTLSQVTEYKTTKMKEILGVEPIKMEDSLIEMVYTMIESGKIKKTAKYTGPKNKDFTQT